MPACTGMTTLADAEQRLQRSSIPLVRALCKELTYHGAGDYVEAVYVWS
jgi:hypothetical protein